jgi:uncharacterized membrane protein YhhN
MNAKKFYIYFFVLSVFYLFLEILGQSCLKYIFKPLLLISLSFYFLKQTQINRNLFAKFIQIALFFSLVGDTFLLFADQSEIFFMLGLLFFLAAHIAYIFAYSKAKDNTSPSVSFLQTTLVAVPFVFFAALVFWMLKNSLSTLYYPVLIYIVVITYMGICAALRFHRTNQKSFVLVLLGALFFMISDTLLAVNKFLEPVAFAGFCIMATYIAAQFLLVEGSILHLNNSKWNTKSGN